MSYLGIDAAGRPKTTKTVTLAGRKVKLDYAVLFGLLERGRRVEKRCVVASSTLWQGLEAAVDWVSSGVVARWILAVRRRVGLAR